ncbi:MAG: hypothetical protein MUF15_12695 [Acidobacteria bacterium]|nr:hypothetical protein [Acidobacteriota bacterium]
MKFIAFYLAEIRVNGDLGIDRRCNAIFDADTKLRGTPGFIPFRWRLPIPDAPISKRGKGF